MSREGESVLWFRDLTINDVPLVGGKNAALGEMIGKLLPLGVRVPDGFAVTAAAYRQFITETGLGQKIKDTLADLNTHNVTQLQEKGKQIREMILAAELPAALQEQIKTAYEELSRQYQTEAVDVAVRSSATAEDLPGASFAGQQETYLHIMGGPQVITAVKKCFASLFTDRAISYRVDKGFGETDVALSVSVQKMVRSDLATSGVMFSIDTETGFDKVVVVNALYGLGETIVQGKAIPDEFTVFKPSLSRGLAGIIARDLGSKQVKLIYENEHVKEIEVSREDQERFCLTDDEVVTLAGWAVKIEKHFSDHHGHYQPMDMEWAKDGETGDLYIVQARPETVHSSADKKVYREYKLTAAPGRELARGIAVGQKIASGKVRVIHDVKEIKQFEQGEVLVTEITDPDWEPIMKIAAAIVTDKGGRTSHAAIVSRELGIPCVVGTGNATAVLAGGTSVTVDCSSGKDGVVTEGETAFEMIEHRLDNIPETRTKVMVNIGSPDEAFKNYYLPVKGVGLGRLEFIINSHIRIHPRALLEYEHLPEGEVKQKIGGETRGYQNKTQYYVDELAEGVAKISAAFYPGPVIIRFSDFKTNEYRTLIGGEFYEPKEENPMIGWRGASRYYHPDFRAAFGLECAAIKKVREEMGLDNVVVLVPFCRTVEEGQKVIETMREFGLDRAVDPSLKIYVMGEIPSNVILVDEFLKIFDGVSIGSNDLTQLVLGLDRDSGIVSAIGNEKNEAVKILIKQLIEHCRAQGKYIGICGQAPSDFPDFTEFLVGEGIESISLSPDTVIKTLELIAQAENLQK